MMQKILCLHILSLIMCFHAQVVCGQAQQTLLVDQFDQYPSNAFNLMSFAFPTNLIATQVTTGANALGLTGNSLEMAYDVSVVGSFCAYATVLPQEDLTSYNYLSFYLKMTDPTNFFQLELKSGTQVAKIPIWEYIENRAYSDWQKVVVPLDAFWNLSRRDSVEELLFVFDNLIITENNASLQSKIYIDDILFGSYFPGYVKIDAFSDRSFSNATGGISGYFSENSGSTNYGIQINCNSYYEDSCSLQLDYDHRGNDNFGGSFFELGNNGGGTPKDLGSYDKLMISMRALHDSTNPGNVLVELKPDTGKYDYRVTGIDTIFQPYSIPFSQFMPGTSLPWPGISQMAIVFQKNVQQKNHGSLLVDDILLAASAYMGKDSTIPADFTNLSSSTGSLPECMVLSENETIDLRTDVDSNQEKLESVFLAYKPQCSSSWIRLRNWFAPLPQQIQTSISLADLHGDVGGEFRFVAESFSGIQKSSETFEIYWDKQILVENGLFRQAFDFFQSLRTAEGAYLDAAVFSGQPFHPVSVSATGKGIIGLVIADAMGWITDAEAQIVQTLSLMNGLHETFRPERNIMGFFRHFIHVETGEQEWDSEFSSIDSGILCASAFFAKTYFNQNDSIARLADGLFQSTNWASAIEDPVSGGLYRDFDDLGNGLGITHPFNEYMILAWLAANDYRDNHLAGMLWNLHYQHPDSLPISTFDGVEVLTDVPGRFLSGFVPQFCYYLCHPFTTDSAYLAYFEAAMEADIKWWQDSSQFECQTWGFGAGNSRTFVPSGYHADDLIEHPGTIFSPHIIAGAMPVISCAYKDLISLYGSNLGHYTLPNSNQTEVFWRSSTEIPTWRASDIQLVDYSTFLFGLATHPTQLGPDFFAQQNDFDFPDSTANYSPRFFGLEEVCLDQDSSLLIPLRRYLVDFNHPANQISLSIQHTGNFEVVFDSLNAVLEITLPSNASGRDTIWLQAEDPLSGKGMYPLVVHSQPCSLFIDPDEDPGTGLQWEIGPNPFQERVKIQCVSRDPQQAMLVITDLQGREIKSVSSNSSKRIFSWDWDGRDNSGGEVTEGIYFVSYISEAVTSSIKLLKI